MKIEQFTHQYSLSKTLRFKLIPQGRTLETLEELRVKEADKLRAEEYVRMKRLIDRYHKAFIEQVLGAFRFSEEALQEYAELYRKADKSDKEIKELQDRADKLRKAAANAFDVEKANKDLFKKELITKRLQTLDGITPEETELIEHFKKFTTYFDGFNENRKNMYTGEGKSTEIAFRIVDQNLPRFLDNVRSAEKVLEALPESDKTELDAYFAETLSCRLTDIADVRFFNRTLSQAGIDRYNQMIGGVAAGDRAKTQGINEKINLLRQKDPAQKLPLLKPLYKQILSDRSTLSFVPEQIASDQELLGCVNDSRAKLFESIDTLHTLLSGIAEYDPEGVFVSCGKCLSELSRGAFGSWQTLQTGLERQYDALSKAKNKDTEMYADKRRADISAKKSYSLAQLQKAAALAAEEDETVPSITEYLVRTADGLRQAALAADAAANGLLTGAYPAEKNLIADDDSIGKLKALLDAVKDFQRFAALLAGTGKEERKDERFYGAFAPGLDTLDAVTPLYNKVRSYATRKPFSQEKYKLNFDCSYFLSGWSIEWAAHEAFFVSDGRDVYMAILNRRLKEAERNTLFSKADTGWSYLEYHMQKIDPKNMPRLFIRSKGESFAPAVDELDLPVKDILEIYENGWFKADEKAENPERYAESVRKMIEYYMLGVSRHESFQWFDFSGMKDSGEYASMDAFYRDLQKRCYRIIRRPIDRSVLDAMTDRGDILLFRVYSKDMSEYSRGTPNLHTLYFRALFDGENQRDVTVALNGGAEMFYREASLQRSETAIHPAGIPIENKNPDNPKKTSVFPRDLIKNRRYTEPQFQLHIPVTLNFAAPESKKCPLNHAVREALRASGGSYVIGIDRGERNLLYVCVIDADGNIVEQRSLNAIVTEYNGVSRTTDYHAILDKREKERDGARKSWKSIEPIRELKEGYISQVVHYICGLVEKYGAVVALEDLNSGFKNSRAKVEKQVYQKFEKMLIDKLNYMADKRRGAREPGGILNAYQLTQPFKSYSDRARQNGILFYVPAWLTSKIDPTTGFVDLLHPKYESEEKAAEFVSRLERISYDAGTKRFVFTVDLDRFPRTDASFRKIWNLESFGTRIRTVRDRKTGAWNSTEIDLTEAFHTLFTKHGIDLTQPDLREQILALPDGRKEFFRELMALLALLMQLRNSKTGTDIDYMLSPVRNADGGFYDSRKYSGAAAALPTDADANGAYHIARKAQWAVEQIVRADEDKLDKVSLAISNKDWLEYIQAGAM